MSSDPPAPLPRTFTYHRRDAYGAILGAILMALLVETVAVHFLISLWKPWAAWVFTGLSAWSAVWLVRDFRAARRRPFRMDEEGLELRVGLRLGTRVRWEEVRAVHRAKPEGDALKLTLLVAPDLWIETREPVEVRGPAGIRLESRLLGVRVDEPDAFGAAVREHRRIASTR